MTQEKSTNTSSELSALSANGWPKLWLDHDRKVKPYLWSHRAAGIAKSALGLLVLYWLILTPFGLSIQQWLDARVENSFVRLLLFFGFLGGGWTLIGLPFSGLHFLIEKNFGLSRQSVGSWFGDLLKGLILGAVIGGISLGILFLCVRFFPSSWWFVAASLLILFSILLAQLTPILLIPLFYPLKPMEPGPLKTRLLELCKKFNVEVKDVFHLGLGMKTEKGNAAFVGLGRTKRILIGDTLYERFSHDEVEAVFAHELGHQVHNDLWKGIGIAAGLLYLCFFVAQEVSQAWVLPLFGTDVQHAFGFFLFLITLSVVQYPSGILQAAYSRSRERAADSFAVQKFGLSGLLADALERLTLQNYSLFKPNVVIEFLSHSHPASWRRIIRLRSVGKPF